jgi:hypothetical protein
MKTSHEMMAKMKVQIGCLTSRTGVNQEKAEDCHRERVPKMDANQEKMDAWLEELKAWQKERTTCQEVTEACLDKAKANPEKMKAGLEEMEAAMDVFKERMDKTDTMDLEANRETSEAVAVHQKSLMKVENVGALEDQYGDWNLTAGLCRQPKKRTQGNGGSWKMLAVTRGRMTRHAIPAPCKGHGRQGPDKDDVVRGTPKGRTFEKTRRARPKSNNGISNQRPRRELHLGSKETFYEGLRQIIGLEVTKRAVASSIRVQKMSVTTLLRSPPTTTL